MAEQVNAYVRSYLEKRHDKDGASWRTLATELGASHVHLVNIHKRRAGAGPSIVDAVAKKLHDGSIDQLREAAQAQWQERTVELPDRYPNMLTAIELMADHWSHGTVVELQSSAAKRAEDPSVAEWIREGNAIEARRKGKAVGVRVDTSDDDTPPAGRRRPRARR